MATSRLLPALALVLHAACATTPATPERPVTLLSLDGADVPLATLTARHDATVLVWWASSCPCVSRYEPRIEAIRSHFPDRDVGTYAIVSNADETPDAVKSELARRGLHVPAYFDPGARLAASLGVRSTPTVVLLDRDGKVRFTGWIDNERTPGEPGREPWLDGAIDGLLAGRNDFPKRSPTWGCPITRSLNDDLPDCCRKTAVSAK